jgi:two-component system, sensor histidine kinase PdtaS
MKQKFIVFPLTLFLLVTNALAITNNTIDSLKQILKGDIDSSRRALVNSHIGYYLRYTDPDESLKYYKIALDLSEKGGFKEIGAMCANVLGVVYNIKSKRDSALIYYNKAIKLYEELHDTLSIGQIYNNMASTAFDDDEDVIECYQKALLIVRRYKDVETESSILFNIGRIYFLKEDYTSALDYFYQTKEANVKINLADDLFLSQAMGYCYMQFNMLDHAIVCFNEALSICIDSRNRVMEYAMYLALCYVYMAQEQYDSVALCLKKVKLFADEAFAKSFNEMVETSGYYLAVDSLDMAGKYIALAEKEIENSESYNYRLTYWLRKSEYYRKRGFPEKSLNTLAVVNKDSLKGISYKFKLYNEYSKVYYQLGEIDKAYKYLQSAMQWKDSLNIQSNRQLIIEKDLTYKYTREKQEQAALQKQMSLETELQLSHKNKLNMMLGTGMLFVLIVTIIVYLNLRRKRTDNKLLLEQKLAIERKEELAANLLRELNHRVKNNLQMVSSLFTMQRYNVSDIKVQEALKKASGRIDSLTVLHQHMYKRDYSIAPRIKEYLTDLCKRIVDATSLENKISLQMNIEDTSLDIGKMTHVGLITNELLTNAIKYGVYDSNNNHIEISFVKKGKKHGLTVSNPIYKNSDTMTKENSSRFGLKLVQTIAQQYQGEVIADFETDAKVEVILYFN